MFFVPQASPNGKQHARFSSNSPSTDDIPLDGEATAVVDADDDGIQLTKVRQFIIKYAPLFERELVLLAIVSLAENNRRRGRGLYAYCSQEFLAERLLGDKSPKAAKRIGRHINYFKGEYGLVEVISRRPSAANRKQQTNIYKPTRKCFEFMKQIVDFVVGGVFLGGNSTRDENRPLVLEREKKERVSLEDENRLSPAQEQTTEQEMPSVSAITDTDEQEHENGGEEKEKEKGTANAKHLDVIRNVLSTSTPYQASEIHTQVSKLARQRPEQTRLLWIKVKEQERDGTSEQIILKALTATQAKDPGDYATYFSATCKKLRHEADISEASRQRGIASHMALNRKFAQWEKEKIEDMKKRAMQAEHTSP